MNTKKAEAIKRKEHFLYNFNISGNYKILKDRIKRSIVQLCETKYKDRFKNMKTFTGISKGYTDQFYSEIYSFLLSKYKEAFN